MVFIMLCFLILSEAVVSKTVTRNECSQKTRPNRPRRSNIPKSFFAWNSDFVLFQSEGVTSRLASDKAIQKLREQATSAILDFSATLFTGSGLGPQGSSGWRSATAGKIVPYSWSS